MVIAQNLLVLWVVAFQEWFLGSNLSPRFFCLDSFASVGSKAVVPHHPVVIINVGLSKRVSQPEWLICQYYLLMCMLLGQKYKIKIAPDAFDALQYIADFAFVVQNLCMSCLKFPKRQSPAPPSAALPTEAVTGVKFSARRVC